MIFEIIHKFNYSTRLLRDIIYKSENGLLFGCIDDSYTEPFKITNITYIIKNVTIDENYNLYGDLVPVIKDKKYSYIQSIIEDDPDIIEFVPIISHDDKIIVINIKLLTNAEKLIKVRSRKLSKIVQKIK
jgi:hypothetical protein